jgi:molybdate transport system substrate-binding protein
MQRRMMAAVFAALALFASILDSRSALAQTGNVVVFAAASLKNALDAIVVEWRKETGRQATISYAASSTLAKQIENGAPADMFISADLDWMDYLDQRQLIDHKTRLSLLGNALVLIAPNDSKAQVTIAPGFALAGLLGDGKLAMADPVSVPAGKYGRSALTKLGAWDAVASRVAAAENVRAALLLVARGEAPLGIVYRTDAAAAPGVRIIGTFPPDTHPPIVYPIALTNSGNPGAAALEAYLQGKRAHDLFAAQGFTVLAKPQ